MSVNNVKCLFKVDKVDIELKVSLGRLFDITQLLRQYDST